MHKTRIFDRIRLRPSQAKTVAERRFADAIYLAKSRQNKHANGAMYLAGFVVECLLKAKLLELHTWLQRRPSDPATQTRQQQRLYSLCYREHDLAGLLDQMPDLKARLQKLNQLPTVREVCAWTVFARYSPRTATMAEAEDFLGRVKDAKRWLS